LAITLAFESSDASLALSSFDAACSPAMVTNAGERSGGQFRTVTDRRTTQGSPETLIEFNAVRTATKEQ
jgi:hypothetical protein